MTKYLLISLFLLISAQAWTQDIFSNKIAEYTFNNTFDDQSGNAADGVATNVTFSADRFGRQNAAADFPGNGYIALPNSLLVQNEITISLWVKTATWGGIIGQQGQPISQSSGSYVPIFYVRGDYKLNACLWAGSANNYNDDQMLLNDDEWHHLLIAGRSGANAIQKIYIDGVETGSHNGYGPLSNLIYNQIGAARTANWPSGFSGNWYFNGLIDDVIIYDRMLSAVEADMLYNASECEQEITASVNPTPSQESEGSVNITFDENDPPYTYEWSNGETSKNLINVGTGTYTVTITNASGCSTISPGFYVPNFEVTPTESLVNEYAENFEVGIDQTAEIIYAAYVDNADGYLKVNKKTSTATTDLGSVVEKLVTPSSISVEVNPSDGTVWTSFAANNGDSLEVYSYDENLAEWTKEAAFYRPAGAFFNNKTILRFSPDGKPFVAAEWAFDGANMSVKVYSNDSGSWIEVFTGQNAHPGAFDMPSYDILFIANRKQFDNSRTTFSKYSYSSGNYSANWAFVQNDIVNPRNLTATSDGYLLSRNRIQPYNTNFYKNTVKKTSPNFSTNINNTLFDLIELNGIKYLANLDNSGQIIIQKYNSFQNSWEVFYETGIITSSFTFPQLQLEAVSSTDELLLIYSDNQNINIVPIRLGQPSSILHVTMNGSENNSGSSWDDAFPNIGDALENLSEEVDEIWVAEGTYKPSGNGRSSSFAINKKGLKLYGGFKGNESDKSERDFKSSETIISGDINDNDDLDLAFNSVDKQENLYRLFVINVDSVTIDGFTLTQANGNGTDVEVNDRGSAIFMSNSVVTYIKLSNLYVHHNFANLNGVISTRFMNSSSSAGLDILSSHIENNYSRTGSAMWFRGDNVDLEANLINNLVNRNLSVDVGNAGSISGPGGKIESTNNSNITANIINSTFADNLDSTSTNSSNKTLFVTVRNSGGNLDLNVYNSIFWNNERDFETTASRVPINTFGDNTTWSSVTNTITASNNIFSEATSRFGNYTGSFVQSNSSSVDPQFLGPQVKSSYGLSSTSSAIDAGDNSKLPAFITVDLNFQDRIKDGVVDLGAFEYFEDVIAPTILSQDITVSLDENGQFSVDPRSLDNGSSDDFDISEDLVFSLDQNTFSCVDIGANTVNLTVADEAGNSSSTSVTVTVMDDLNPTAITQDISVQLDANGAATITAAEVDNGSTDNCSVASVNVDVTTFDCSNVGANTVTLTVTDASGNTATSTATVTIEDSTAPTVLTQDLELEIESGDEIVITPQDIDNGTSDNCSISLSLDQTNFTVADVGENTVTLTAEDAAGNIATAEALVTIIELKESQTITFGALANKVYGDAAFSLTASASSGLDVNYEVVSGSANINGSELSITGTGTVTVRATQDGNDEYNAAEAVEQSFDISKAGLTISVDNKEVTYAEALPEFTYQITGFVYNEDENVLSAPVEITSTADVNSNVGEYDIIASGAAADNYDISYATAILTIVKASQAIIFDPIDDVDIENTTELTLSASATSALAVSYEVLSGPATVNGNTLTLTDIGSVSIAASQPGNENYEAGESVTQSFDVFSSAKEDQTISFEALAAKTFGDDPFELTASASSGLSVSYSSSDETVATIQGTTVTILSAGTTIITASQAGNDEYNPAASVSRELLVNKADQEITIEDIEDKDIEAVDFEVVASTTSGLELTYSVLSGPATINNNLVSLNGNPGMVEIEVSQAGNINYNAASATVSFEVIEDPCIGFDATATVVQNVSCNGAANGSFEVAVTHGTAPFTYNIGGESQDNGLFGNQSAGNYEITVTDANGCSAVASVEITEPTAIEVTAEITDSNSISGNGSISLTATGGSGNFTFDWSNGATTASLIDLEIGEYTVTVTDEAGCSITESYTIGGVTANREAFEIKIYPNPVIDQMEVIHGEKVNQISLIDASGKTIVQQSTTGKQSTLDMKALEAGIYFIRLDNGKMSRIIKQ